MSSSRPLIALMISDLPIEILHIIFKEAFEHDPTQCYYHVPQIDTYSVPVSTVSRHFRAISLSLPELWCCIHIDFSMPVTLERSENRSQRFKAYLARSQPRDISVHLRHMTVEWSAAAYAPLFLQPSRWCCFTITTMSLLALDAMVDTLPQFNRLHTFHLESLGYHSMNVALGTPLPSLTRLRIRDIILLGPDMPILQNLTDLVICDHGLFFIDDLCRIAGCAPYLTRLVLYDSFVSPVDPVTLEVRHPPPPVTFRALRTLTLHHPRIDFEYILAQLIAPHLEKIELFNWRSVRIDDPNITIDLVGYIPALRELRIVDSSPARHELRHIQPLTSTITSLDLSGTDFSIFEPRLNDGTWCPQMDAITVTKVEAEDAASNNSIAELVRVRAATGHPLVEVNLGERLSAGLAKDDLQLIESSTKLTIVEPTSIPRYWVTEDP